MTIVCMGELLIDFVSLESGVQVGDAPGFQKAPGGAPANVAVAVARLGQKAAFLGQVGDDPFGHFLVGVLASDGVDVRGLKLSTAARTMLAFVSLGEGGERSFVFYRHPSADMLMTPDDVNLSVIDAAKIFHYGSISLITEPSKSATIAAIKYAQSKGITISYDPNLRLNLWPDAAAAKVGMLEGLEYANILKISDDELEFLTGGQDVTPLWREGLKLIVVTHGAEGATAYTRENSFQVSSYKVESVDTTGAGDGFVAGLLVSIVENPDIYVEKLPEILRFANAVGAIATTKKGAIPALPTREQVTAFIAAQ